VSSRLRVLPKRGEAGRRRLDVYTLVLTIILAVYQALGIAFALLGVPNVAAEPGTMFIVTTVLSLTGGVIFLTWLAGQITARGVGNGIALILAVGIVAELPAAIAGMLELGRRGVLSANFMLSRRRLEVTFRRQAGERTIEGQSQLQLKLNNAGIVPTILASWLLLLPLLAANLGMGVPDWILEHLKQGKPVFIVFYGVAIVLCVFFYMAYLLNPDEMAEDLKKHGGVIAGVAPGEATASHIDQVVSRVSMMGAVYLAFVYVLPQILIANWSVPFYLGGTSLLIVVCAILDVKAQLERPRRERGWEAT
jgi:preprotein translocase subunit SecY